MFFLCCDLVVVRLGLLVPAKCLVGTIVSETTCDMLCRMLLLFSYS